MPAIVGLSRAFCNPCDRQRSRASPQKKKRGPSRERVSERGEEETILNWEEKKNLGSRACSQVSSELTSQHHPHEEKRRGEEG